MTDDQRVDGGSRCIALDDTDQCPRKADEFRLCWDHAAANKQSILRHRQTIRTITEPRGFSVDRI